MRKIFGSGFDYEDTVIVFHRYVLSNNSDDNMRRWPTLNRRAKVG